MLCYLIDPIITVHFFVGLSKASLEEEWVSSGFSSDANNIKE
jgi:hypothetical protein